MERPTAVRVSDVSKSFRSGPRRTGSWFRRSSAERSNEVLKGVSFEVEAGEFLGIMGRNGSGKSTLLMLLAGIYAPDRGSIEVAGRLAPFLQLGIGFNAELPAYENAVMNSVMMGLTPAQARKRFDVIMDFAGLREHEELELKNYSSGMKVRLGFSIMAHVEADILLVDEVLAVGDADFAQRCDQVFRTMHAAGRTIILVSHSIEAIGGYCDRAMLIENGRIDTIGDPDAVTGRYLATNLRRFFQEHADTSSAALTAKMLSDPPAEIASLEMVDPGGEPASSFASEEPITLRARIRILREMAEPGFYFNISSSAGILLVNGTSEDLGAARGEPGEVVDASITIHTGLGPGGYAIACAVSTRLPGSDRIAATNAKTLRFEIEGDAMRTYVVAHCDFDFDASARSDSAGAGASVDRAR